MRVEEMRELLALRRWEPDAVRRRLARAFTIDDLRRQARSRLPRAVFDYIDGAAWDEVTLRRNRDAFADLELLPRVLVDVSKIELATTMLGSASSMPIALAPTGFTRMMHHEGERAVGRAAARADVPYALSTVSTTSIERLAEEARGPLWFQLYALRDRNQNAALVDRARRAGYGALILTVDAPVMGSRERDYRAGLTIPPSLTWKTLFDGALHPSWWWNLLSKEAIAFEHDSHRGRGANGTLGDLTSQFDDALGWDDVAWLRDRWDGPFALKGVMTAADAVLAAEAGVSAVIVSNHGGRQLDHVPATIEVLPEIVAAVGARTEVLLDSGIRRGTDVVKALALGARGCLVGRAYLYGLGAAGQAGVEHALALLRAEIDHTMRLIGTPNLDRIDASLVRRRAPRP